MKKTLKTTEPTSLAIHSVLLFALHKDKLLITRSIAQTFYSSKEVNRNKIRQGLIKPGFTQSTREFQIGLEFLKPPYKISLPNIFKVIGNPFEDTSWLFQNFFSRCDYYIFYDFFDSCNRVIQENFGKSEITIITNNL